MYVLPEVLSSCKQDGNIERAPSRANRFEPSSGLSSLTCTLNERSQSILTLRQYIHRMCDRRATIELARSKEEWCLALQILSSLIMSMNLQLPVSSPFISEPQTSFCQGTPIKHSYGLSILIGLWLSSSKEYLHLPWSVRFIFSSLPHPPFLLLFHHLA